MSNGQQGNFQGQQQWGGQQQQNWGGNQGGGYQQGPQGGYQGGGQDNGNGNGNGNKNNSYDSFCEITLIGNISGITDPESKERVHAYSKPMNNGAKVANTNIAVNLYGKDEADFWKIEVWANSPERSRHHNFLMDHCTTGRKLFIKGVPMLNFDKEKKSYYPTIRVTELIGLGGGQQNGNGGGQQPSGQSQGGQQNSQPQGGQQGWGGNQQGFQQQQNGFGGPNPNMQGGNQVPQQPGGNFQQNAPQGMQPGPGGFGAPQGGFGGPQGGPGQFQGQR